MRRPTASVPVVTSALVGAVVLAAVWVTNAGAVPFVSGGEPRRANGLFGHHHAHHHRGKATPKPVPTAHPHGALLAFEIVGYIALGGVVLVLLAFVASATVNNRRGPRVAAKEADDVLGAFDALSVPAVLLDTTQQQLTAIRQGTPRNAIVACWWELERSAEATGFPRAASETSSEFTQRVLNRYLVEASSLEEPGGALSRGTVLRTRHDRG